MPTIHLSPELIECYQSIKQSQMPDWAIGGYQIQSTCECGKFYDSTDPKANKRWWSLHNKVCPLKKANHQQPSLCK